MWMLYAASKISPGRKSENSSSFVRCGGSTTCSEPAMSPTTTSATVYGTRVRLTAIATRVAIENNTMKARSTRAAGGAVRLAHRDVQLDGVTQRRRGVRARMVTHVKLDGQNVSRDARLLTPRAGGAPTPLVPWPRDRGSRVDSGIMGTDSESVPTPESDLWLARGAVVMVIALQAGLVNQFAFASRWLAPALEVALLIPLVALTLEASRSPGEAEGEEEWVSVTRYRPATCSLEQHCSSWSASPTPLRSSRSCARS